VTATSREVCLDLGFELGMGVRLRPGDCRRAGTARCYLPVSPILASWASTSLCVSG
jgi:hypothetical protein